MFTSIHASGILMLYVIQLLFWAKLCSSIESASCNLHFLAFGDWGKGGIYGDIRQGKQDKRRRRLPGEDGEHEDHHNEYTYQLIHAEAMGYYAGNVKKYGFLSNTTPILYHEFGKKKK